MTAWPPSLTPRAMPVCEWQSMRPGVTCLPATSTTTVPAGTSAGRPLPTATILPARHEHESVLDDPVLARRPHRRSGEQDRLGLLGELLARVRAERVAELLGHLRRLSSGRDSGRESGPSRSVDGRVSDPGTRVAVQRNGSPFGERPGAGHRAALDDRRSASRAPATPATSATSVTIVIRSLRDARLARALAGDADHARARDRRARP